MTPITIRPYTAADAAATLEVFWNAIRVTAAAHYSPEQIDAWAARDLDVGEWSTRRAQSETVVAVVDGSVAGFTDVDTGGYIDMMFVHPAFARLGVATQLFRWVLHTAERNGSPRLTATVSLTARPFFEAHGFVVERERFSVVSGVALTNYAMSRDVRLD